MSVTAEASAATVELPPLPDSVIVQTRFGDYTFTADHRVYMPKGPLGFQDYHDFALANLPNPELDAFKLLESLDARPWASSSPPCPRSP